MQILEPDLAIPFLDTDASLKDFHEKAAAACETASLLGLNTRPTKKDFHEAEKAFIEAIDPAIDQKELINKTKDFKPATYALVKGLLSEYSIRTVDNAVQIRQLVTNKLILESENQDPKIRIRALELLGKITDVGLFTEKSEVTVTHRSSEDLVSALRAKIQHLREPKDITPRKPDIEGEVVDLSAELGLDDD